MIFDCSKDELMKALSLTSRGVAQKNTTNNLLEGILFSVQDDGLYLTATNSEIAIQTKISANVTQTGEIVLKAGLIGDIIRKLSGDTVFFKMIAPSQLRLECQLSTFTIQGFSSEEFPVFPYVNEEYNLTMSGLVLKEMIHKTIFAIAANDNIPILTGVKLEIENDQLTMITIDGYRMALCKDVLTQGIDSSISVIVPGKSMQELSRMLDADKDSVQIRFSKTQIFFEFDDTVLTSRLLEGEFINYKNIIPEQFESVMTIDKVLLSESCERAALMARSSKNNLIRMTLSDSKLEIESGDDSGAVYEVLPMTLEGKELRIAFNARFIIDALRVIPDQEIVFSMTNVIGPAIITSPKGKDDHYSFMILPIRIAD